MQIIIQPGQAEQTINKSRFVALAEYCADERAVGMSLRRLAAAHQNAHHLAYAFRLKTPQGIVQRFSDAGEPSGTAGKPVLQFLEGRDLINVCVGVIRYYGGINLGTGGLARAYGGTAKMALDAAQIGPFVEMQEILLDLDYKQLDIFTREISRMNGEILDKAFGEFVTVIAMVPASEILNLQQKYG
ncbi:YigZ family protein [Methylobacillus caricis]|uniref:IMPACT family protein n=1 Tax=Methylobacillus caricis TaxID=1971611 RepID=UPI001D000F21|nr:YigZ family protein [Methylobacillus caricis]MCB5187268.1 YigZ family protein [Methylobacillus caricis]